MNNTVNSQILFGERTRNSQFAELELIDPSTFEDMHNVVEVVITKMYNNYMEKWRISNKFDNSDAEKAAHRKILESFQTVYEGLSLVRNPRKFDDLEQDYEGTISKIARAGDSAKLKQYMKKLVEQYLAFMTSNCNASFLVIPIDDLDVNISLAYKMMEQIRKYLILPNVILIMAVKIEQLRYCVELQFRREMALLIEKERRMFDQEPIDMAAKYVAKLIPDGRKITLPELRILVSKDEEDAAFDVEYIVNGRNLFAMPEESDEHIECTFEDKLLSLIFKLTGLVFVSSVEQVHPLVPQTLRELVNLASVLGRMEVGNPLRNLEEFESYFINTWVPSQLDDGYVRNIRSLFLVQPPAMHRVLCSILLDKLEVLSAYTLDTTGEGDTTKIFDPIKKTLYAKSKTRYSLGDVVSLLNFVENRYVDLTVIYFVFAIRAIYSITMRKMALSNQFKTLTAFVGSNVFGNKIIASKRFDGQFTFASNSRIMNMVQTSASENISRIEFSYNAREYLTLSGDYLTGAAEHENHEKISTLLFFSNFSKKFSYFISGNNSFDKEPFFTLENLFISPLYDCSGKFSADARFTIGNTLEYIPNRELISLVTTNLEFLEFLYDYCVIRRDPGSATRDAEHIRHFLNNFNDAAKLYLFENVFDNDCVNWIVVSFEHFWGCRANINNTDASENMLSENMDSDNLNNLRKSIEPWRLGRVCSNATFQKRAEAILKHQDNAVYEKNNIAKDAFAQIKGQLSFSKQQNDNEKIDKALRINFNTYIGALLEILEDTGENT